MRTINGLHASILACIIAMKQLRSARENEPDTGLVHRADKACLASCTYCATYSCHELCRIQVSDTSRYTCLFHKTGARKISLRHGVPLCDVVTGRQLVPICLANDQPRVCSLLPLLEFHFAGPPWTKLKLDRPGRLYWWWCYSRGDSHLFVSQWIIQFVCALRMSFFYCDALFKFDFN